MERHALLYRGINLYFTTNRSIENIASEIKVEPSYLSNEVDTLYRKCLRAYDFYIQKKVTQGKAAELAEVNKSIFLLFLRKYSLPIEDCKNSRMRLRELQDQLI